MKETRYFYDPEMSGVLSEEESKHAIKVLRLQVGDTVRLLDGKGKCYQAEITDIHKNRCAYRVCAEEAFSPAWSGYIHVAVAPTKHMDRMEWFVEKATEIGVDEFSFLNCQYSERRVMKTDRVDKVIISAVKQSHKFFKPILNEMEEFDRFISQEFPGDKYICHCYPMEAVGIESGNKPFLLDLLKKGTPSVVLIGPEGDFSVNEVKDAMAHGFVSVSLGESRLRTETAALVAAHLMQIRNLR